ncbi:hypothetical protein CEF21_03835 [Bacillus sp. FJAT-42376]|uniref:hypothetical protein n=1 Tax=Bacillus sp. FJAT-42376 TaxID=2014076 RepID=UPI000F4D78FC|nr:hypothetical protein [Bacillus sp. FJAT-42376]AZB41494.1 hypothetical protein CEF21_03835 [Bacillus sp. FJAT-42376]
MKIFIRKVITAAVSAFIFSIGLQAFIMINAHLRGFPPPDGAVFFFLYSFGFYVLTGIPVSVMIDFLTKEMSSRSAAAGTRMTLYFLTGGAVLNLFFRFHIGGFVMGGCAALLFLAVESIIKKRRSISS